MVRATKGGALGATQQLIVKTDSPAESQNVANPFHYIDAQTVNTWNNSNPSAVLQVSRTYNF